MDKPTGSRNHRNGRYRALRNSQNLPLKAKTSEPRTPDSLRAGAGQAATRLLRSATAPTRDSAPTLRLKALVWPKDSFRPGKPGPTPPFPS